VLPLLLGDEIVARLDLKADRRASVLRVHALHLESGVAGIDVIDAVAGELHDLATWLGLDGIAVGGRSAPDRELAAALRTAPDGTGIR